MPIKDKAYGAKHVVELIKAWWLRRDSSHSERKSLGEGQKENVSEGKKKKKMAPPKPTPQEGG